MSTDIVSRITAWLQLHERAVASNDQGEIRYAEHICPMELVKARDEIVRLREALVNIERMPWPGSESPYALIARAALEAQS